MELKITKEKILEAADKCNTAKETLKILFPEAFGDEKISIMQGRGTYNHSVLCTFTNESSKGSWATAIPDGVTNGDKIQLNNIYDWELYSEGAFQYIKPKHKYNG